MAFLSPLHFPPLPFSSSRNLPPHLPSPEYPITTLSLLAFSPASTLGSLAFRPRKHFLSFTACKPSLMMHALSFAHPLNGTCLLAVCAAIAETNQPKWWEKNAPNMIDIHSTQEFLDALGQAGDRLVIVEFYGTWCASCRALYPKICRTAEEHPDILFLKVNFDENKPMCKSLTVKVLPYFHFYRGADGLLESFSCSLAKFQKIKDAVEMHNTARCSLGPPKGISNLVVEPSFPPNNRPAESS